MRKLSLLFAIPTVLTLAACGAPENVELRMASIAPGLQKVSPAFESVLATFSNVAVHTSADAGIEDEGWVSLGLEDVTIDLMAIQDSDGEKLAGLSLPAGHYQQARVTVESMTIPNSTLNLTKIPMPEDVVIDQHTVRFPLSLTVEAGVNYGVVFNFDAYGSVYDCGEWRMDQAEISIASMYIINADGSHTLLDLEPAPLLVKRPRPAACI